MSAAEAWAYALALGIAAAIPGPGITALIARSVGSGSVAAYAMLGGLIVGDIVLLSFAVFGLAFVASQFAGVFIVVKFASVVWLSWLAWGFWTAGPVEIRRSTMTHRDVAESAVSGLLITLGNPKALAFYLALLPAVINLQAVSVVVWAAWLVPLTVIVLLVVGSTYILGAMSVRTMLSSAAAQQGLYRGAALAMAGAAVALVLRS